MIRFLQRLEGRGLSAKIELSSAMSTEVNPYVTADASGPGAPQHRRPAPLLGPAEDLVDTT